MACIISDMVAIHAIRSRVSTSCWVPTPAQCIHHHGSQWSSHTLLDCSLRVSTLASIGTRTGSGQSGTDV